MNSVGSTGAGVLLVVLVVVCAWVYPQLNGWVYRRRVERDVTEARRADEAPSPQS